MYFQTANYYFDKIDDLDDLDDFNNNSSTIQKTENNITSDEDTSDNTSNDITANDCLICLEINDKSDNICIKLQNDIFIKPCLCDGWIHYYCLDVWYLANNKCPICLTVMTKIEIKELPEYDITTNTMQNIFTKLFLSKNIIFMLKILFLSIMFYNITFIIYKILIVIDL